MLMNMEVFTTLQLLWLNLVTDSIPAIMLAFEKADKDVMENNLSNHSNTSFFTPFLTAKIVIGSLVKSIIMIVLFVYFAKKIDVTTAVLGLKSGRIRANSVELCMDMTENLVKRSEIPGRRR